MISIIVTTHNHEKFITKCLNSILKNDKRLLNEIIVINDNSIDSTEEKIKRFIKKYKKVKYFCVKYSKPSKSKNFGVKKSNSKWIIFVDGDDFIKKDYLQNHLKCIKENVDFAYSNIFKFYTYQNLFIENQRRNKFFKYLNNPVGGGCLIKKKIWIKVKGINENLFYQDDYDFWLKIHLEKKLRIKYLNYAGYFYRKHNDNRSKNFFGKYYTKVNLLIKFLKKKLCQVF